MGSKSEYSKLFDSKKNKHYKNEDVFSDIKSGKSSKKHKKKKKHKKNKPVNVTKMIKHSMGITDDDDSALSLIESFGIRTYEDNSISTFKDMSSLLSSGLYIIKVALEEGSAFINVFIDTHGNMYETGSGYSMDVVIARLIGITTPEFTETDLAIVRDMMESGHIIDQVFKMDTSNLTKLLAEID